MIKINVLGCYTGHHSKHQRQPFCKSSSTKPCDNTLARQRTKAAQYKHQISVSISSTTMLYQLVKLPPFIGIGMLTIVGPECIPFLSHSIDTAQQTFLAFTTILLAQEAVRSHNSPVLITLAKFLHSGPALGFLELEHTQYYGKHVSYDSRI